MPEQHNVYVGHIRPEVRGRVDSRAAFAALEVYLELFTSNESKVPSEESFKKHFPSGMATGELICFLYARGFPKAEWREKFKASYSSKVNL